MRVLLLKVKKAVSRLSKGQFRDPNCFFFCMTLTHQGVDIGIECQESSELTQDELLLNGGNLFSENVFSQTKEVKK